jgi:ABC-2 type transport system ATP-binding protein
MLIEARGLSKSFNQSQVLKEVSIQCAAGEICGLVGANGAGKTTLFKILLGLVSADSGAITINSAHKKAIGGIVEKPALYGYLNAFDNIRVFGSVQGMRITREEAEQLLRKVGLSLSRKDPVRNYSLGMKQRLGIAIALLNNPKILILDEPFSGLDPLGIISLKKLIKQLTDESDIAVLISSHIVEHLFQICDSMFILKGGEILQYHSEEKLRYKITAKNIRESRVLSNFEVQFSEDDANLMIEKEKIPRLLRDLLAENFEIIACTPFVDMETWFEIPDR